MTAPRPAAFDDFVRPERPEATPGAGPAGAPAIEAIPHVVAWNLTERCNLACAHCYIAAGPWRSAGGELTTDEVRRIADEILALNPAPMFVLSGGEPLLRDDLETIAAHAKAGGATVVVGTNGTGLTAERIASLQEAGVTGVAVSVDSLTERYHDRFRHGTGSLGETLAAVERLVRHGSTSSSRPPSPAATGARSARSPPGPPTPAPSASTSTSWSRPAAAPACGASSRPKTTPSSTSWSISSASTGAG